MNTKHRFRLMPLVALAILAIAVPIFAADVPIAQPLTDTGNITLTLTPTQQVTTGINATLTLKTDWAVQIKTLRTFEQSSQQAMTTPETTFGQVTINGVTFALVPQAATNGAKIATSTTTSYTDADDVALNQKKTELRTDTIVATKNDSF